MTSDRTLLWTLGVLGFVFLLSFGLYIFMPGSLVRTVLRFPAGLSLQIVPEARSLPFRGDKERDIELLVREILLGPAHYGNLRLFSRQASLRSLLVRGNRVYIDLSKTSFLPDPDVEYSPVKALDILKETLVDNFPEIAAVMISVEGEPAGVNVVDKG